jgi:hypothetical protein
MLCLELILTVIQYKDEKESKKVGILYSGIFTFTVKLETLLHITGRFIELHTGRETFK